jgi:predicted kinase
MTSLAYLYGPPAAGKLTIATRLAQLTGARLFHNHLTVDALTPVFAFASPPFTETLHRLRLDVLATAARHGIDVIFTNNSAWSGPDGRQRFATFADAVAGEVADAGGATLFVQVTSPPDVLAERVDAPSRHALGKLVDPARLAEMLATHDPRPLHPGALVIDSAAVEPADAARRIAIAAGWSCDGAMP